MLITLEMVRDEWRACYTPDRLEALYPRPCTPLEVCIRKDGPWADVPAKDRLWTVLRGECVPKKYLRLLACMFAEDALLRERACGREPDAQSWNAVAVSRLFAEGRATKEQLAAAGDAAEAAARAAARAAAGDAWDAAEAAARAAARAAAGAAARAAWDAAEAAAGAAWAAARAAAGAAADAAARAAARAAWDAARAKQLEQTIDVLKAIEEQH